MRHSPPSPRSSLASRPLLLRAGSVPSWHGAAGREPLTPDRAAELRRRFASGEFDTPRHAQMLARVLLGRGVIGG